jgi:general secretion pathway protein K
MAARKNLIREAKRSDDGFIIVAVLWILIALATLTSVYAAYVVNTAFAVGANDDQIQSEALVNAGIELTAYRLMARPLPERPSSGETRFHMGGAAVAVSFRSENSRIDINVAPEQLLSNLFVVLGAAPEKAGDYAARIVAWRSRPTIAPGNVNVSTNTNTNTNTDININTNTNTNTDTNINTNTNGTAAAIAAAANKELSLYQAAGKTYGPREAPFPDIDELWLVLDLPPDLVKRAMPYLTVYSVSPKINVLAAASTVLAALPGMTPDLLGTVLALRQNAQANNQQQQNNQGLLQLLGPAQTMATVEASRAFRLTIGVRFDNGRQRNAEVVIALVDDIQSPYHILSWRDDLDQMTSNAR